MPPKTIAIGADHAGYGLKRLLNEELARNGHVVRDMGTDGTESVDYPDFAALVASAVLNGDADGGILMCGSGIGMSIAANRSPGIRAALCFNEEMARLSRQHNDANILVLGARFISEEEARKCLDAFLTTEFEAGRHVGRVGKLG